MLLVSHSMEDVAEYVDRILVMNKGQLIFDDVPKEVFKHHEELEEMGLAAPQVTYIMDKLIKEGVVEDSNATTILEAKDEILKAFQMKLII